MPNQPSILIVDDEFGLAEMLREMLREYGYDVTLAINGRLALDILAEQKIDLVLTDISLNGEGDGTGVARAARERGVPVLFVTAKCVDEAPLLALGCLTKPFSERVLKGALEAVDGHLQGRRMRKLPRQLTLFHQDSPDASGVATETGPELEEG